MKIKMPRIDWLLAIWSLFKGMVVGFIIYIPTMNGDVAFAFWMLFAYLEYFRNLPEQTNI